MATNILYLNFVVAFFTFVEETFRFVVTRLYGWIRPHIPSILEKLVLKTEGLVSSLYSTFLQVTSEKGTEILEVADNQVLPFRRFLATHFSGGKNGGMVRTDMSIHSL